MLEQLSWLSQTIAALAIIASLVYAALQCQVYAKAARETRYLAAEAKPRTLGGCWPPMQTARICREGLVDYDRLDPEERWRFWHHHVDDGVEPPAQHNERGCLR